MAESKTILKGQSPCCRSKEDIDLEIYNERTEDGVTVRLVCGGCKKGIGTSKFPFPKAKKVEYIKPEPTGMSSDKEAEKVFEEFGIVNPERIFNG